MQGLWDGALPAVCIAGPGIGPEHMQRRVLAFDETVRHSFGQGGLLPIRSDPCSTGTINVWAGLAILWQGREVMPA